MLYQYQSYKSPIGKLFLLATHDYLINISFVSTWQKNLKRLGLNQSALTQEVTPLLKHTLTELNAYFTQNLKSFSIPYQLVIGTPFQKEVWQILATIPYGQTITYKDEAIRLGRPQSYRTVANANGMNLLPIIIPCHRVIGQNHKLSGYTGGGLEAKKYLLELEN